MIEEIHLLRQKKGVKIFESIQCCLCNVDDTELLLKKDWTGTDFNLVRCKRCGLVYINPRLARSEPREVYEGSFGENLAPVEVLKIVEKEKKLYEDRFKQRLVEIERHSAPGKILDIGSGSGFFLEFARAKGWQCYGVETARSGAEYAQRQFRLNIFNGELAEANFPDDYFRVVTMWHVLEHSPEPLGLLKEVRRILQKDGLISIEVPNLESRRFKKLRGNWEHIKPHYHLYYFTKDTLTKLLNRAGFEVRSIKFYSDTGIAMALQRAKLNRIHKVLISYYRYLKWLKRPIVFSKAILGRNDDKMVILARSKP